MTNRMVLRTDPGEPTVLRTCGLGQQLALCDLSKCFWDRLRSPWNLDPDTIKSSCSYHWCSYPYLIPQVPAVHDLTIHSARVQVLHMKWWSVWLQLLGLLGQHHSVSRALEQIHLVHCKTSCNFHCSYTFFMWYCKSLYVEEIIRLRHHACFVFMCVFLWQACRSQLGHVLASTWMFFKGGWNPETLKETHMDIREGFGYLTKVAQAQYGAVKQ